MPDKPKELEFPDLNGLRKICVEYLEFLDAEDYHEDCVGDYIHFIYEAALEALYGEEVWQFTNAPRPPWPGAEL